MKRSKVGYFKVRRKNFKIQSKSNLWARKKNLKYKFKRKDIYIRKKKKQNPIYYISSKNQKKKFKKRNKVGYFKVRRKNFKIQSKSNLWARKKILKYKYKFKRNGIFIRKTKIKSNRLYFFKNQKKKLRKEVKRLTSK